MSAKQIVQPGAKFGRLTVIADSGERTKNRSIIWRCRCECGNTVNLDGGKLLRRTATSCGCCSNDGILKSAKQIVQPGAKFGRLTVIEDSGKRTKDGRILWRCQCECGNTIDIERGKLLRGSATSCGCAARIRPDQRDITGERFGMLTAEYCTGKRAQNGSYIWHLRCDCGNTIEENLRKVTTGYCRSCGCRPDSEIPVKVHRAKGKIKSNNTSGVTGVSFNSHSKKWISQIHYQGKVYYLGCYQYKEDAVNARKNAEDHYDNFMDWYLQEYPLYRWKMEYRAMQEKKLSQQAVVCAG